MRVGSGDGGSGEGKILLRRCDHSTGGRIIELEVATKQRRKHVFWSGGRVVGDGRGRGALGRGGLPKDSFLKWEGSRSKDREEWAAGRGSSLA